MDTIHMNYDSVFKEAMVLYKNKALDFLGLTGIAEITEPLMTKSVEIEVRVAIRDLTFGLSDGKGTNFENEVDLSRDDLLRFGSYNLWLSRAYKREFITVIFVKNPTKITELRTEQLHFKPIIVQCSEINADEMLEDLRKDIAEGKSINELKLVYLPLFSSAKLNPNELFKEGAKLIKKMQVDDDRKMKMYALSIVLASKVVDKVTIQAVLEEVKKLGNVILEVSEAMGERRKMEEIVRNMLNMNYKLSDIIKITGIEAERLIEIQEELLKETASA